MSDDGGLPGLMKDIARAVRSEAERRQLLPRVEAGLAARAGARRTQARTRWLVGGTATCLALGAALFVLMPRSLSFVVAGAGSGTLGATLRAPAGAPLALRFSDGSEVTLPARAQARVEALERHGATVAVEAGAVDVAVVHRPETAWEIQAGGYRIKVTGTRFRAAWNPNLQELTVQMREGSVLVSGPGIAFPTRLVTGERLRASADEGVWLGRDGQTPTTTAARVPTATAEPAEPPPSEEPPAVVAPVTKRRSPEAARPAVASRARADWRGLAARAQYRESLAAAVAELNGDGWTAGCARLGADDVVLLGDVARLAGDLPRADEAYQSARRRFPSADRPTFALGLIAFEGRHDYGAAAGWFEAYLRRYPRGALAREAAGRLLESRLKAGDDAAARAAATTYLRDFPGGPHAELARRTVGP